LRSGAGAISALFGLLFVPPLIMTLLPASWQDTAGRYLPMNAAESVYIVHRQAHSLAPWAGFAVFCAYAAAALLAGFIMMSRRDAGPGAPSRGAAQPLSGGQAGAVPGDDHQTVPAITSHPRLAGCLDRRSALPSGCDARPR